MLFLCFVVPVAITILMMILFCRYPISRKKRIILAYKRSYKSVSTVLSFAWSGFTKLYSRFWCYRARNPFKRA
jgi:hypothetical protein